MKATQHLHDVAQSLWLDNITRDLLDSGTLKRYIDTLSVTGLTSNPSIFDNAIAKSTWYDSEIRRLGAAGLSGEALFFELAIQDLSRAADLFAEIHTRTATVDGWVSLEVSPLLAYDTAKTAAEAKRLHVKVGKPNVFIKIPGTTEGLPAIEEAIFSGVPINVTLLFSQEQYLAAADAYMKGLERRVAAHLSPDVRSVASLFVSRWDKATTDKLPATLSDTLGIAISCQSYAAYRNLLESDRWQRRTRLIPCRRRLFWLLETTEQFRVSLPRMVALLKARFEVFAMRASMLRRLRSDYRRKEPRGSLPLGTIYSKRLRRRAKRLVSESFPRHSSAVGRSHILRKNLSDHVAVNIGQSSIDAVVFES